MDMMNYKSQFKQRAILERNIVHGIALLIGIALAIWALSYAGKVAHFFTIGDNSELDTVLYYTFYPMPYLLIMFPVMMWHRATLRYEDAIAGME